MSLCFGRCGSQKASISFCGCASMALQLGQRFPHKVFLGETFDLPTTVLPLFVSPLGLSHFGFVLELEDPTVALTESEHQSCVNWRALC